MFLNTLNESLKSILAVLSEKGRFNDVALKFTASRPATRRQRRRSG